MLPDTVVAAWTAANAGWISQIFDSYTGVDVSPVHDVHGAVTGHTYTFRDAKLRARLGALRPTNIIKGAICGNFGGVTKTGTACKKAGTGSGGRCGIHPLPRFDVHATPVAVTVLVAFGAPLRSVRPLWSQMHFTVPGQDSLFAVDYLDTPCAFVPLTEVVADCLADAVPKDFVIECHLGTLAASPFWRIEKLRALAQYQGPWTASGQAVAAEGCRVGDYAPGVWTAE